MSEPKPWWWPEPADHTWCECARICYGKDCAGLDDDAIRAKYNFGRKFLTGWDCIGDARDEYELLAESFLGAFELLSEVRKTNSSDLVRRIRHFISESLLRGIEENAEKEAE